MTDSSGGCLISIFRGIRIITPVHQSLHTSRSSFSLRKVNSFSFTELLCFATSQDVTIFPSESLFLSRGAKESRWLASWGVKVGDIKKALYSRLGAFALEYVYLIKKCWFIIIFLEEEKYCCCEDIEETYVMLEPCPRSKYHTHHPVLRDWEVTRKWIWTTIYSIHDLVNFDPQKEKKQKKFALWWEIFLPGWIACLFAPIAVVHKVEARRYSGWLLLLIKKAPSTDTSPLSDISVDHDDIPRIEVPC